MMERDSSSTERKKSTKKSKKKKKSSKKRERSYSPCATDRRKRLKLDGGECSTSSDSEMTNVKKKKKKSAKKKKKKKEDKKLKNAVVEKTPLAGQTDEEKIKTSKTHQNMDDSAQAAHFDNIPKRRPMIPMTKEEYEKQQSIIRRVYDPETGRNRLVKGDGEILEEIVSYARHKEINKTATQKDGVYFSAVAGLAKK